MFDLTFGSGRAARQAAQQRGEARQRLLQLGVPLFPDGMLRQAVAAAPELGRGTFGACFSIQVYAGSRPLAAAAKLFHGQQSLQQALREALAYHELTDVPGVPRLLGVSLAPLCLVTTLHGPRTLLDALCSPGTPAAALLRALAQLAATLRAMHERRLCHNDLKFDNVLLDGAPDAPAARATLVDMGAVRRTGARPYHGRQLSGDKYPYLAPEVLRGGPVSPASDAFSLGWMLEGVLDALPPASPARAAQGRGVARQCMHQDPARRLSVAAAQDAITNLLLDSP
ncbi:serine/threonine-protein kinase SBK2-like [Eriocheir sinensis]|uniref:serine/threonine-protein kinase SBK2-like n=1 Tax=Eriocheir sinensis TaxID=95602 RepID=UPI0021C5FABF|nr:serine/threonine-protein kinase SBK2-like [Eriocheir sinensis]